MTHENETLNTLAASWLTMKFAVWFGRKEIRRDGLGKVTLRHWRGVSYLTNYERHS